MNFQKFSTDLSAQTVIDIYRKTLLKLYDSSYEDRNIKVPIKANICGTDEVGVRELSDTTVHEFQLVHEQGTAYHITNISSPLDIKINGVTTMMQLRADDPLELYTNFDVGYLNTIATVLSQLTVNQIQHVLSRLIHLIQTEQCSIELLRNTGILNTLQEIIIKYDGLDNASILIFISKIKPDWIKLSLNVLQSIAINSYKQAAKHLNVFAHTNQNFKYKHFCNCLLQKQECFSVLLNAQILNFIAHFYGEIITKDFHLTNIATNFLNSIEQIALSSNPATNIIGVRTLLYGLQRNDRDCLNLIMKTLTQHSENINLLCEIANFIKFWGFKSFDYDQLNQIIEIFIINLTLNANSYPLLSALVNLAVAPARQVIFLHPNFI